jgi:hypothetical protein
VPLLDSLNAELAKAIRLTSSGQTIISTSGNGASVQFATPAAGSDTAPAFGPVEIVELCEEMIVRHSWAISCLATEGTSNPAQTVIFNRMLADMVVMPPDLDAPNTAGMDFSGVSR